MNSIDTAKINALTSTNYYKVNEVFTAIQGGIESIQIYEVYLQNDDIECNN